MSAVTYRESCGSARGAMAHQQAGEPLCGWCLEAEALARLNAEAVPQRPPAPAEVLLKPVSEGQAQANRKILAQAIEGYNWFADRDPLTLTAREVACRDAAAKAAKFRAAGLPIPAGVRDLAAEHERSRRKGAA